MWTPLMTSFVYIGQHVVYSSECLKVVANIHGNLASKSMFVYFTAKSVQLANFGTFFVD